MSIVAGIDFGTLSVRVSILDSEAGLLGSGSAQYPLQRTSSDPDFAEQSHADHIHALSEATKAAVKSARIDGRAIESIALDTTGSSVLPVGEKLEPLGNYYMWCDHRAWREAELITRTAHCYKLLAIDWYGGTYSSEWGFSKVLHWLRHNPEKRGRFVTALEHCDMIAAVLCGIEEPSDLPRSICAMGHKWMWNRELGGFPPDDFFAQVDPLLKGVRAQVACGHFGTSDNLAGHLSPAWAKRLGLREGIPIPIGALDAHWDAIGAGIQIGDAVNVIGTSTCIIGLSESPNLVPGVCGVVPGSVHPRYTGIEAGLSATGDIFDAIARRAATSIDQLSHTIEHYRPGQTGLLRLVWDNGDRTVLVNPELGGITFGWNLMHSPSDELFAAIEGTAFHTRIILERMQRHGSVIRRVINSGGIPTKSPLLNQIYANVLGKPILVPKAKTTGLGSAIFAFVTAGSFKSIEAAQKALCPQYQVFMPEPGARQIYDELYALYCTLYFAMGDKHSDAVSVGGVLPALRRIAALSRCGRC